MTVPLVDIEFEDGLTEDGQQRREPRIPTSIAARIVLATLDEARECLIKDISQGGAKLLVGDWDGAPKDFYLLIRTGAEGDRLLRWCERRWQVGPTIGVRFRDAISRRSELLAMASAVDPTASYN